MCFVHRLLQRGITAPYLKLPRKLLRNLRHTSSAAAADSDNDLQRTEVADSTATTRVAEILPTLDCDFPAMQSM